MQMTVRRVLEVGDTMKSDSIRVLVLCQSVILEVGGAIAASAPGYAYVMMIPQLTVPSPVWVLAVSWPDGVRGA